jgi:predicted aspartyl protease
MVTAPFGAQAKINLESANRIVIKTVGGTQAADLGYAESVSVGKSLARGVAIAVHHDKATFGDNVVGLLGMSFLARFNVRISQTAIELTPIQLR